MGDWTERQLGDVARIEHGWAFKGGGFKEWSAGEPVVVSVGNFDYSGGFRFETTLLKSYGGDYPAQYALAPGDILVVMTCQTPAGEILGIPGRVPDDGRKYLHNQRLGKVVANRNIEVDPAFLYWLFLTKSFNAHLVATATGTKIVHTAPSRIEGFRFQCPPIGEQQAIASSLFALDDKIELNRRMAATLEEMARALFKSWFVDFDPVRAKADGRDPGLPSEIADLFPDRLVDSPLGPIPEGWTVAPLDRLANFLNGLALQKFPVTDEARTLPVIKIAQLRAGSTSNSDTCSSALRPEYIVNDGDVLFSWSGSLECTYWAGGRGALNQHLFKVTSNEAPLWLGFLGVRHHLPSFRETAAGKATTMGHIQRHHLTDATLAVPRPDEVAALTPFVEPIVERSWKLRVQNRQLTELRDALLPKLVSGEIRIADPEAFLAKMEAVA